MIKKMIKFEDQKFNARLGLVHWKDACICIKTDGKLNEMADCISIGFICEDKDRIIVVHNFTDGTPDDYILIPRVWKVSITHFKV